MGLGSGFFPFPTGLAAPCSQAEGGLNRGSRRETIDSSPSDLRGTKSWTENKGSSAVWRWVCDFLSLWERRVRRLLSWDLKEMGQPWECMEKSIKWQVGRLYRQGNGTPLQYLAWKIPWTEEPGGLQSMGSERVGHNWTTEQTHTKST